MQSLVDDPSLYRSMVFGRLLNFFHHRTTWQRRLWTIGTVVGLEEVVEYAEVGTAGGMNKPDGLNFVAQCMAEQVRRDEGATEGLAREGLLERLDAWSALKRFPDPHEVLTLREQTVRVADGYLDRWASALDRGERPSVERLARCVASHLLDQGFSADFLRGWAHDHAGSTKALAEVLREAHSLVCEPPRPWTVFVPLAQVTGRLFQASDEWIDAPSATEWLAARRWSADDRVAGALLVTNEARDPWAAVAAARQVLTRTAARVTVAFRRTDAELTSLGWARVDGESAKFQLREPRSQIDVPNLRRAEHLAGLHAPGYRQFDDALELAAQMEEANPATSITGGWAAIESLLCRPGEGGATAADRMGAIVAASWGRAELTSLAWVKSAADDGLGRELDALGSSYKKASFVETWLRDGGDLGLRKSHDVAAQERMRELVQDPGEVLQRVRSYVTAVFRRLYNQRNMIMHAGSFDSCALPTTLRTAAPLVGAGLDRIAWSVVNADATEPGLAVAARAELELSLVGQPGGRSIVNILD